MVIYDWDDTLQKNLEPKSSLGMFLKTLLYSCNSDLVKKIFNSEDQIIITTRSRLYTFAIKLKCFMITFNINAFSDTKVTTINPYFFYQDHLRKQPDEDMLTYLKEIEDLKIRFASVYNQYALKRNSSYTYVDFDLLPEMRKDPNYDTRKDSG